MIAPSFEIRSATQEERPRVEACIVTAFVTDPAARFAVPAPDVYLRVWPLTCRAFADKSYENGTAFVSTDFRGVALWLPPRVDSDFEALDRLIREFVPHERLADVLATAEQMGAAHPTEPHWYLPFIGVDPSAQNEGLGRALMLHALARCDAACRPTLNL